jgi:hypothetical protein
MSNDNKYIFIPYDSSKDTEDTIAPKIFTYYMIASTVLTNMSNIPLINYYFAIFSILGKNTSNLEKDSVYSSIPKEKNIQLRMPYGMYLLGKNPPSELLDLDSDKSKWNDISLFFLTTYKLANIPGFDNKKIPKGNGIIPDNICIQTDSKDVISVISSFDCRNIKDGTPYVLANGAFLPQILGASSSLSSYCSCICCIVFSMFIGGGVAHTIIKRR